MEIIKGSNLITQPLPFSVVTIGNFDGVHIGHQSLFGRVIQMAREMNGKSVVLTFEPHPVKILAPGKHLSLLTSYSAKMHRISEFDIDIVICEPFTLELAEMSAQDFVNVILVERLGAKRILVGSGFTFGKGRLGNFDTLKTIGQEKDFSVEIIDPVRSEGEIVSSSRIRLLVQEGKIEEAAALMGRPYSIEGLVVKGFQMGNTLGFPTANVASGDYVVPARGVYASRITIEKKQYQGVVNVGINPTFDRKEMSIEAHIFDFNHQVYDQQIEVSFIRRIRNEIAFSSSDALVRQIQQDVREARTILAGT